MKLLVITAVEAFEKDIKQLLKQSGLSHFSYQPVMGYRDASQEALGTNWFASEMNEAESVVFYAFVKKEMADSLFALVDGFNAREESQSKVHVAVLNIEKYN